LGAKERLPSSIIGKMLQFFRLNFNSPFLNVRNPWLDEKIGVDYSPYNPSMVAGDERGVPTDLSKNVPFLRCFLIFDISPKMD